MRLLVDNDALWKLAACDLLDQALQVLEVAADQVFVLESAAYKFGVRGKSAAQDRARRRYGDSVVDRLSAFLPRVGTVDWVEEADPNLLVFENIERIDAGEAILVAGALLVEDESLVATGDKAFLEALASSGEASAIRGDLAGCFIGLEQILDRIWQSFGFEFLRSRIVGLLPIDRAASVIFSQGARTPEDHARAGLDSYLQDLHRRAGGLLSS